LTENSRKNTAEKQVTSLFGDSMVNKKSPYYVRSEFTRRVYGNDNYTTLERKLKVTGMDRSRVKSEAEMTKSRVMP